MVDIVQSALVFFVGCLSGAILLAGAVVYLLLVSDVPCTIAWDATQKLIFPKQNKRAKRLVYDGATSEIRSQQRAQAGVAMQQNPAPKQEAVTQVEKTEATEIVTREERSPSVGEPFSFESIPMEAAPLKEGRIQMIGGRFKTWKERYIILYPQQLNVFQKKEDVPHAPHRIVSTTHIDLRDGHDHNKTHSFIMVQTKGRNTGAAEYFAIETLQEKNDWMNELLSSGTARDRATPPVQSSLLAKRKERHRFESDPGPAIAAAKRALFAPEDESDGPPESSDTVAESHPTIPRVLENVSGGEWETCTWLNTLLPLIMTKWYENERIDKLEKNLADKFTARLNALDKPKFIGDFAVTKLKIGRNTPFIDAIKAREFDQEAKHQELRFYMYYPGDTVVTVETEIMGSWPVVASMTINSLMAEMRMFLPETLDGYAEAAFMEVPEMEINVKCSIGANQSLQNMPPLQEYLVQKFYNTVEKQYVLPSGKFFQIPVGGRPFVLLSEDDMHDIREAKGQSIREKEIADHGKAGSVWMCLCETESELERRFCIIAGNRVNYFDHGREDRTLLGILPLHGHFAEACGIPEEHGFPFQIVRKGVSSNFRVCEFFADTEQDREEWLTAVAYATGQKTNPEDEEWKALRHELRNKAAVRIQTSVRRMLAQRLYTSAVRRREIVELLVESERLFVRDLRIITEKYLNPLLKSRGSDNAIIESATSVLTIFGKADKLVAVHETLLRTLEEKWKTWSIHQCVGDAFVTMLKISDSIYRQYCEEVPSQLQALAQCEDTYLAFREFLRDLADEGMPTLNILLPRPLFRMEKYIILLTNLNNETPMYHKDKPLLNTSVKALRKLESFVAMPLPSLSGRKR